MLPSLVGYRRGYLGADVTAGLALLALAVPEQLATARLAGMPPLTGYFAFVAGSVCFALLGSNRRLSVGADSTIAPLFAVGIAGMAVAGSARYVELVAILSVLVGVMVLVVGLVRLGWIAQFLSDPIITGFLAGVAVIIAVHQLPDLLGLPAPAGGGVVHRLVDIAGRLDGTNWWSLGIGIGVLVVVVVGDRVDRGVPGALIGLVASTALVAVAGLRAQGVAVLGVHGGIVPRFGLAGLSWSAVGRVVPLAAVVALVVVSQTAATTQAFADAGSSATDVDHDFVGVGAGSIVAGLAGAFPVDASPPRTAAVATAGGRTQLTGLLAAGAVVALVPAAGLLDDVPLATLAAILLVIAARIVRWRDLLAIARFSRVELGLAAVCTLTVALVGVEQGIAAAVGLAILDRARLAARPQLHVLGRVGGTTSFAPLSSGEHAAQVPGVLVVLFATPLWYANSQQFRSELGAALDRAVGEPRAVVLDAVGMTNIDFTGVGSLRDVLELLDRRGITFAVARAGDRVRVGLDRGGLLERIGEDRLFGTVGEAVDALVAEGGDLASGDSTGGARDLVPPAAPRRPVGPRRRRSASPPRERAVSERGREERPGSEAP